LREREGSCGFSSSFLIGGGEGVVSLCCGMVRKEYNVYKELGRAHEISGWRVKLNVENSS
jgi:hypothetical protein